MPRTLAQNATYINETIKPAIKAAIEAQGVTVPSTDSFLDYADRISEIEGGGSGYQLKDLPTGSISTVTDAAPLPLNALKVSVEAVQDLHGYDHPWPAGGGINKLPNVVDDTVTDKGITVTATDGKLTISGTATGGSANLTFTLSEPYEIKSGDYLHFLNSFANSSAVLTLQRQNRTAILAPSITPTNRILDISGFAGEYIYSIRFYIANGVAVSGSLSPMVCQTSTATSFAPYSNICPISGWDSGEITVCDDIDNPTHTETTTLYFPTTIYGAEWDVINGELGLKITDGFYSSYNGETLPGIWMSDRDVYQAGTTPTIGAEVKYKLATPTYITLTGLSIRLLEGTNNIYADCGEVLEGEYFIDEGAIDVRKVDYQIGASGSIKTTDGRVLSGFASMSGYHARPLDASGNWLDVDWSKDFEIGVAFKFTAFPTYQGITGDGNYNSWRKAPRMDYDNSEGKIDLCVSSDGSTLAIDAYLDYSLVINKWYFIKLKFVQSTMTLTVDITEDFSTFTSLYNNTMASAPYHDAASLCFGGDAQQSNMASNTFLIDTFNTYIKGDGADWGAFTGVFPS